MHSTQGTPTEPATLDLVANEIPLKDGRSCIVHMPRDLTHSEALRIGAVLEALAIDG